MPTDTVGDKARLFPWQVTHYMIHGGFNDPVTATAEASGTAPATKGYLSFNSSITMPVPPGTAGGPSTMTINSGGTLTSATGVLATSTNGIYLGTVPQGSWLTEVGIFCYTGISGGTSTSAGIFYCPANTAYAPATLWALGYILSPAAGILYTSRANGPTTGAGGSGNTMTNSYNVGPGNGVSATPHFQGASLGDIDIYFATFLIGGSGTAPTAGSYAAFVSFTGLEG